MRDPNELLTDAIEILIDAQETIEQLKPDAPIIETIEKFLVQFRPET